MINITKMKLFPYYSQQISIPNNEDKSYNIIFISENESFLEVYPKLMIRRQFAKKIKIVPSIQPKMIVTIKNYIPYKKMLGLIPELKQESGNVFVETDDFFNKIDSLYGAGSYRKSNVLKRSIGYLDSIKALSQNKNILMYHVNLSKQVAPMFINRKSIILGMMLKMNNGAFPFDVVTLAVEREGKIKYYDIQSIGQTQLKDNRIIAILKSLVPKSKNIVADSITLENKSLKSDKQSILAAIAKYQKQKVLKS